MSIVAMSRGLGAILGGGRKVVAGGKPIELIDNLWSSSGYVQLKEWIGLLNEAGISASIVYLGASHTVSGNINGPC